MLKIEQSLDTIGKSGLDCRGGAVSDNVGPTTTILSSLSKKLDTIQAGLDIHKWEIRKDFFSNSNEEIFCEFSSGAKLKLFYWFLYT